MHLYQYLIVAALCGLYFNKRTSYAALILLLAWVFYITCTIKLSTECYYATTALVELLIGYALNKRYRLVSYMSYTLIPVNLFGLILFNNGLQPTCYDIIYAIISIAQILLLITRLAHGRIRLPCQYAVDNLVNFDGRKARDTM